MVAILILATALAALLYISVEWRINRFAPAFLKYSGMTRITYIGRWARSFWLIGYLIFVLVAYLFDGLSQLAFNLASSGLACGLLVIPLGEHVAISRYRRRYKGGEA